MWVFIGVGVAFIILVVWLANRPVREDKHDYDLDNPTWETSAGYKWPKFKCRRCGKTLGLDRWQMDNLNDEEQYGCLGHPPTVEDHIDAVNACLREKMED